MSVSVGTGISSAGKLMPGGSGIGLGNDSDSDASITQAAISGVAGNKDARTGDAETGIAQIFDAGTVQREIDAQTQITQTFGQQASKAIGDYANTKLEEARHLRTQAGATEDVDRSQQLLQQAADLESTWGETGTGRVLAHVAAGGLTAGLSGAAGAAAGTLTAPYVADQLAKAGVDGTLANILTATASTATGALAGGAAGAATAFNEVTNNYLSHQEANRYAALQSKKMRGQCDAACDSELKTLAATDKQRDAQLAACDGVESSACTSIRHDVRSTAAGYVRANQKYEPYTEYALQRIKTEQLAQQSMDGVRLATLEGFGQSIADGVKAAGSGLVTGLQAMLGDPQAREQVKEGAQKAFAYLSVKENWLYLIGVMTPETREQLALAYERGDGKEVGRIMGEQFANMPITGGGLGTIRKVGKVIDVAEDGRNLAVKLKTTSVGASHSIDGDIANNTNKAGDGLAFRSNLSSHMIGPDVFSESGQLSGTHNLNNATAALDAKGATYALNPTSAAGISELQYTYTNPETGKVVSGRKTVYDPAVLGDQTMLNNAQKAGQLAWTQYLQNPTVKIIDITYGGVNFRSYVNVDKNGNAYVGNVHPIK